MLLGEVSFRVILVLCIRQSSAQDATTAVVDEADLATTSTADVTLGTAEIEVEGSPSPTTVTPVGGVVTEETSSLSPTEVATTTSTTTTTNAATTTTTTTVQPSEQTPAATSQMATSASTPSSTESSTAASTTSTAGPTSTATAGATPCPPANDSTMEPDADDNKVDCPMQCESHPSIPVCGTDGIAYDDICQLWKKNCGKNVSVGEWEACRGKHPLCPAHCLDIYDPVCGDDCMLYPNLCVMRKRNCGLLIGTKPLKYCYREETRGGRMYEPCPTRCQEFYRPVCGSDGRVYVNECYLRLQNCGLDVQVVPMERCAEIPACPEMCVALYDPVCGSDGRLYLNYCRMVQENCGKRIERMPHEFCQQHRY